MSTRTLEISKVTLAVENMDEMVIFYNNVLEAGLIGFDAMETKFYSGKFAGMNILLCPNGIAGVDAKQSRLQFDFIIDDINKLVQNALSSHGTLKCEINESNNEKTVTIADPDGNTMNFIERK